MPVTGMSGVLASAIGVSGGLLLPAVGWEQCVLPKQLLERTNTNNMSVAATAVGLQVASCVPSTGCREEEKCLYLPQSGVCGVCVCVVSKL